MRQNEYYNELLYKYASNDCSPQQEQELMNYLASDKSNKMLLQQLRQKYNSINKAKSSITPEQSERIKNILLKHIRQATVVPMRKNRVRFLYAAAVIFGVLLIGAAFFYRKSFTHSSKPVTEIGAKDSIVPGSDKALITLSDGSKYNLQEGIPEHISKKLGIVAIKNSDGTLEFHSVANATPDAPPLFNTIQTPRGGQCRVILPDGSKVWMNAESSLKFPLAFKAHERNIDASGEVYFEVMKNNAAPFKVFTGSQVVEVLGTHFIINSSKGKSLINTTLLEGSVRLTNGNESQLLKPGQKSKYNSKEGKFVVTSLKNTQEPVAWKEGYFTFDNTDFATIQEQLEKWYDVAFEYQQIPENHFYGKIERNASIEEVLKMMEIVSKNIHFKIQGRKIYVIQDLP